MSLWGRRSASLVDVVQEAGKACFDDIPGIKKKRRRRIFICFILLRKKSFSGQRRATVMAERIGINPLTCAAGLIRFAPAAVLPSFWPPAS